MENSGNLGSQKCGHPDLNILHLTFCEADTPRVHDRLGFFCQFADTSIIKRNVL